MAECMYEDIEVDDNDDQASVKVTGQNRVKSIRTFDDSHLGLNPVLVHNIRRLGYNVPTPIQCHGMPQMMAQLDLMCCSYTGSGKTATYLLPIINAILSEPRNNKHFSVISPRAVVLTPTRELAEQICRDVKLFSNGLPITALAVFGGDCIGHELVELKSKKTDILVATPGRLQHLLTDFSHVLSLTETKFLVIDEADEMFNRSFFPQINAIVMGHMKPKEERVTAMFSATFPNQIQYYAKKHLRTDFVFVIVGAIGGASPNIIQEIIPASQVEKQMKLHNLLLKECDDKKVLIFCNTIDQVDNVVNFLRRKNLGTEFIHSRLLQHERDRALKDFNDGRIKILVATSVASRGLNIDQVGLVINYDLPECVDEYVQRIGRARMGVNGEFGVAISFYDESTDSKLLPDLTFALSSANQAVPEFMVDDNQNQNAAEDFDEYMDEDMVLKLQKFSIRGTYETNEDSDWWG